MRKWQADQVKIILDGLLTKTELTSTGNAMQQTDQTHMCLAFVCLQNTITTA